MTLRSVLESAYVKGALGAIVGGLVLLGALHLWTDHATWHQLLQGVQQAQAKTPTAATPAAEPKAP